MYARLCNPMRKDMRIKTTVHASMSLVTGIFKGYADGYYNILILTIGIPKYLLNYFFLIYFLGSNVASLILKCLIRFLNF